jgi:hypothetical protein
MEIFLSSQREEYEKLSKVFLMIRSKGVSNLQSELSIAEMIVEDSPSKMNFFSCNEETNLAASLAARASLFT